MQDGNTCVDSDRGVHIHGYSFPFYYFFQREQDLFSHERMRPKAGQRGGKVVHSSILILVREAMCRIRGRVQRSDEFSELDCQAGELSKR
jgi:hypothetical protein